jgi:hypothetical protein
MSIEGNIFWCLVRFNLQYFEPTLFGVTLKPVPYKYSSNSKIFQVAHNFPQRLAAQLSSSSNEFIRHSETDKLYLQVEYLFSVQIVFQLEVNPLVFVQAILLFTFAAHHVFHGNGTLFQHASSRRANQNWTRSILANDNVEK